MYCYFVPISVFRSCHGQLRSYIPVPTAGLLCTHSRHVELSLDHYNSMLVIQVVCLMDKILHQILIRLMYITCTSEYFMLQNYR